MKVNTPIAVIAGEGEDATPLPRAGCRRPAKRAGRCVRPAIENAAGCARRPPRQKPRNGPMGAA